MRSLVMVVLTLVIVPISTSSGLASKIPEVVKIAALKPGRGTKKYVKITKLSYEGKTYYSVPPISCCDLMETLYSDQGEVICHPSGGIAGRGDGKCPGFIHDAKTVKSEISVDDAP